MTCPQLDVLPDISWSWRANRSNILLTGGLKTVVAKSNLIIPLDIVIVIVFVVVVIVIVIAIVIKRLCFLTTETFPVLTLVE